MDDSLRSLRMIWGTKGTGTKGKEKGERTERRFFEAMNDLPKTGWVFGLRPASEKEDRKGIDAVFFTDVGKLFIQIKSSEAGAIKFKNGSRHSLIRVIVVREHYSPGEIREKTINILNNLRKDVLATYS